MLIAIAFVCGMAVSQETVEPRKSDSPPKKVDEIDGKLWVPPEKYKELEERFLKLRAQLDLLEKKQKERLPVGSCKLSGQLDGDVVVLRAECSFDAPADGLVFLGLKNGYLMDQGELRTRFKSPTSDQMVDVENVPHIETIDEGFVVRVGQKGTHRLTLNLRVPVTAKKTAAGIGNERGFELGLPGSAVTLLNLKLPDAFKDLRWSEKNDGPTTAVTRGGDVPLGKITSLAVTWKEPSASANTVSAEANLKVKIEEQRVEITGDIVLEDAKNPKREWHLLLPAKATISPAAGSSPFTVIEPDGKGNPAHIIRLTEPAEKVTVAMQASFVRSPQQRLPVGPVLAEGTPMRGVILIQASTGAMRGQRLIIQRFGEIFQRDPTKAAALTENIGLFQFWNAPYSGKGLSSNKALLELEWKTEKGQIEAAAEHDVKMRQDQGQWLIDVETRFAVQAANSGVDTLDVQTLPPSYSELLWLGVQPAAGFPGTLTWPAGPRRGSPISVTASDDIAGIDIASPDAQQRVRLKLNRPIGKETSVLMQTRLSAAADSPRLLLDLPKLTGVVDRGAKVTLWVPAGYEFLVGGEPVHEKLHQSFEQMPASMDVAWRGSRRDRLAKTVALMTVRGKALHVRQTLLLPKPAWTSGPIQTGQVALKLPPGGIKLKGLNLEMSQDGRVMLPMDAKDEFEIRFEYDVPLPEKAGVGFVVPLVWPTETTSREAKLHLWTEPGTTPVLTGLGEIWAERPLEAGGEPSWPALVAAGAGPKLPVTLRLDEAAGQRLPSMMADRSLIRVHVEEDGSQVYRCRYLVKKFAADTLEVELPMPWDQAQATLKVDGKEITGLKGLDDPLRNRVRVAPLAPHLYPQPVLLEIEYRVPANLVEGRRFWLTPLSPPVIVGGADYGATRWQVSLGPNQTPLVLGSASVDYQWQPRDWLFSPVPSVTSAELDAWIGAPVADGDPEPISIAWWRGGVEPERIYQFPQKGWLVFCSVIVLMLGLIAMLTPAPRYATLLIVLAAGLGLVALGLFHDSLLAPVFLGCEPGLAVLLLIGLVHLYVQERRRRRLTFAPTFARIPQGSTQVRVERPRDPSTVDAPAGLSGSVSAAEQGS